MLRKIISSSIVKNPTKAKYLWFKIHLQKFNEQTQMSQSDLCMITTKDLCTSYYSPLQANKERS